MQVFPQSFADVTPEWLTAAQRSSGCLEHQTVVGREIAPIGEETGFASRM